MAKYYFDLHDGRLQRDETGQDVADMSQVCFEIRRTLADLIVHGSGSLSAIVNVRDNDNQTIVSASISLTFNRPDTRH